MARSLRRALAAALVLSLAGSEAAAWPVSLVQCLIRDARRLVPRSLGRLLLEREEEVLAEAQRFPPELGRTLALDLSNGTLQPETLAALVAQTGAAVELVKQRRVSEGIVKLGATLRIAADLSDPVLSAGPEGYPAGVVREYYAFIEGNLDKIPVVLDDPPALELKRERLAPYWQELLARSRSQSGVIRTEMFPGGRLLDHSRIDFRSPVFGVASLSYSRAVTAIAATWLVIWRQVRGDVTRQPQPVVIAPQEGAPDPFARPTPRPLMEASRP